MVRTAIFFLAFLVCNVMNAWAGTQYCKDDTPKTTPSERFLIDYERETVLDTKTGLMWKRCLEGKSGADCDGSFAATNKKIGWYQANDISLSSKHAGYDDWRLPTADELEDIVERSCSNPAINLVVFPGTPNADVWTSSLFIREARFVRYWYIDFRLGIMKAEGIGDANAIRLVRDTR